MVGAFWVATKVGIEGRLGDIEASCSGCIFIGPRDFDLHQGMNDNSRVGLLFGGTAQEKGGIYPVLQRGLRKRSERGPRTLGTARPPYRPELRAGRGNLDMTMRKGN